MDGPKEREALEEGGVLERLLLLLLLLGGLESAAFGVFHTNGVLSDVESERAECGGGVPDSLLV